jgi:hypothetical protein
MIPPNLETKNLFIALCERLRWWLWFDAPQKALIEGKGQLDEDDIRRIARHYSFARNLPSGGLADLAASLRSAALLPVTTLEQRSEVLAGVIKNLQERHDSRFRLASGTTKLFWFVSPNCWTPFDRLASLGLGARSFDTLERMRLFYRRLDEIDFVGKAEALDHVLAANDMPPVGGARVFDMLLMLRGDERRASSTRAMALAFGDGLPGNLRDRLIAVGNVLSGEQDGGLGIEMPS